MESAYLESAASGMLREKVEKSKALLSCCTLCPRRCRVDRLAGERGFCGTGRYAEIASFGPHFGEEQPLVGEHGSGTIFFCGCNLLCVFCQNYDISHPGEGGCSELDAKTLARLMIDLQRQGCHNINFVTPTHVVPHILQAVEYAVEEGLIVPIVYNCGGYESLETLQLLEGVVDIYMPDFKFWKRETASLYMKAPDYPEIARASLKEMQAQVGDLCFDGKGVAVRGVLVRHLLMPEGLDEARAIFNFIASEVSTSCYINIMDQYRPCGRADQYPGLQETISTTAYREAVAAAKSCGLERIDSRDFSQLAKFFLSE